MRGDSCVAGEGRVVGIPKFHSWDAHHRKQEVAVHPIQAPEDTPTPL